MKRFDRSRANKFCVLIVGLIASLSSKPAFAEAADFQSLRLGRQVGMFVNLPAGPLVQSADGTYELPTEERWHMVQTPFAPYEEQGDFSEVFRTVWSLFNDSVLPSPDQGFFWPRTDESEQLAGRHAVSLDAVFEVANSDACGGTVGDWLDELHLICLVNHFEQHPESAVAAAVEIGLSSANDDSPLVRRALLVFDRSQLLDATAVFLQCKNRQNDDTDGCPRLPGLLIHDEFSLETLASEVRIVTHPDDETETALELGLFEAISTLNPVDLAEDYLVSQLNNVPPAATLLFSLSQTDHRATTSPLDAAMSVGLGLSEEAILHLPQNMIEGAPTPFLRLSIGGRNVDQSGDAIRRAFLPRGESQTRLVALPAWLYRRLSSISMDSQLVPGRYCRRTDTGNQLLWRQGSFDLLLGGAQALIVDQSSAPSGARDRLYNAPCEISPIVRDEPVVLNSVFASTEYSEGLCGVQREGVSPVSGVAGTYFMSPIIDPPAYWAQSDPFVLANSEEGVFVQSRPVTLDAFSRYLTSPRGCGDVLASGGVSSEILRCDEIGRFRLQAEINAPDGDQSASRRIAFQYFYGAIGAAIADSTGRPAPGLTCHNSRATASRSANEYDIDRLCSIHFFLAARAADRLTAVEQFSLQNITDTNDSGNVFDILQSDLSGSSDIDPVSAERFATFSDCSAFNFGGVVPPGAQALCSSLQRYVRATFGAVYELPWQEAPVTMVTLLDAANYRDWQAVPGTDRSATDFAVTEACNEQLDVPTANDLISAAASEETIRRDLLPELDAVFQNLGDGPGFYASAVLASSRLVQTSTSTDFGVAGIPVGFRELTDDRLTAQVPNFEAGESLDEGFGLPPSAVLQYFDELDRFDGQCLECRVNGAAFWWRTWSDERDAPNAFQHEEDVAGDPATGFRLVLRLLNRDAQ